MQLFGGYRINNGDLSTMTPLQLNAVSCITTIIHDYKTNNKPLVTF